MASKKTGKEAPLTKAQLNKKYGNKKYDISLNKRRVVKRECVCVRRSRSDEVTKCSAPILGEQQPERRHTFNNIIIIRQAPAKKKKKTCLVRHSLNSDSAPLLRKFEHSVAYGSSLI